MPKEPPKPLDFGFRGIPFKTFDLETGEVVWVTEGTPEGEAFLAEAARHCEQVQRDAEQELHQKRLARRVPPADIRPALRVLQGGKP